MTVDWHNWCRGKYNYKPMCLKLRPDMICTRETDSDGFVVIDKMYGYGQVGKDSDGMGTPTVVAYASNVPDAWRVAWEEYVKPNFDSGPEDTIVRDRHGDPYKVAKIKGL